MIKKVLFLSPLLFFVSCTSYQNEFKNDVVTALKELNDIPAGIDENGKISLETIEFHCEFAQENIQEYQEENLLMLSSFYVSTNIKRLILYYDYYRYSHPFVQ